MYEQKDKTKKTGDKSILGLIDNYFQISALGSNIKTEILAGLATFMTMAYIAIVNPNILSAAGMDKTAVFVATCLAAALATLLMGLYAKHPFALASGMGLNAVLTFGVCLGMGVSWQIAMGVVVIEGALVTLLVLTNLREYVMNSIPKSLKLSIGVAIGLFIAFIGFMDAKMIVSNPATLLSFGNIANPIVIVAILGIIIIMLLMALKIKGSILYGIILTTILALVLCFAGNLAGFTFNAYGNPTMPNNITTLAAGQSNLPAGDIIQVPTASAFSTLFQMDIIGALTISMIPVIFAFMMVDFFDTMGTVVAVSEEGKLLDKNGKLPRLNRVLLVDSVAAMIGGFFGASSVTTYVESASGVATGGKTGLTAVVVGILFLIALPLVILINWIPAAATAPALIIVGFLMIKSVKDIKFDVIEEGIPAFLTIVTMVFTFSIAKGIGAGFIAYCLIKLFTGKWKEVHPIMWALGIVFALYFIFVAGII